MCSGSELTDRGKIVHPRPSCVAGVEIDLSDTRYRLVSCLECDFTFKDPPIDEYRLMECYKRSSSDHWEESPDPHVRQFDRFATLIKSAAKGRRVLDIGCFNGAFLEYLGEDWDRYGIEPSAAAAKVAGQRGVNVLAANMEDLDEDTESFDVVLAIDLLEHLVEPLPFFHSVKNLMKPAGVFLTSTGNSDAFHWRIQGGLYYYTRIPEHVSFYNKQVFEYVASSFGWRCAGFHFMPHKRLPTNRWVKDTIKNAVYVVGCRCRGFGIAPLYRKLVSGKGPSYFSASDHVVCLFQSVG